jgi:hypothetical protein
MCVSMKRQLAALLFTHEHCVCFDFMVDLQLPTDIHDRLLDCTDKRPAILIQIVRCDRLATIASHV